ncbi:DUF922 domain-containing protein [Niabella aquatica]
MQFFSITALAQGGNSSRIIFWTEGKKLQLQDFRVVNDSTKAVADNVAALTRTGITYYLTTEKVNGIPVSIRITVQATVHKEHTFIKERVLDYTPSVKHRLLLHEQRHFDISEIFARQAARELQTLKLTQNYQKEIADFVNAKFKAAEAYHRLYDADTQNGEDFAAQDEWDDKIAGQLMELDRYKKKVVIRRL